MKRVLVTGSEGEVGSVLLRQLSQGYDAVGFDRVAHEGDLQAVQGDLNNLDEVVEALDGVEAIAHLAAYLPGQGDGDPGKSVDANVRATSTLLEAAVKRGVRRIVYCSTVWASGQGYTEPYQPIDEDVPCDPVCIYGQTKLLGERMTEWYARRHGIETVVLRFCGYNAVRGYRDDGAIDWADADIPALFLRYLGAGFKLMSPTDLAAAFGQAIESPQASGERFVIGCVDGRQHPVPGNKPCGGRGTAFAQTGDQKIGGAGNPDKIPAHGRLNPTRPLIRTGQFR